MMYKEAVIVLENFYPWQLEDIRNFCCCKVYIVKIVCRIFCGFIEEETLDNM